MNKCGDYSSENEGYHLREELGEMDVSKDERIQPEELGNHSINFSENRGGVQSSPNVFGADLSILNGRLSMNSSDIHGVVKSGVLVVF